MSRVRSSLIAACVLLLAAFCSAKDTKASVKNDDRVWILLSKPFGFGSAGRISIRLSNVKVRWPELVPKDYSAFGVYLASAEEDELPLQGAEGLGSERCAFLSQSTQPVTKLFSFETDEVADMIKAVGNVGNYTFKRDWTQNGVFSVLFANCVEDAVVSFDIRIKMYNLDSDGEPNYLSVGEQELPTMYLCMCVIFTCGLAVWCWTVYTQRATAHAIHYLMAVLALFKVMTLLTQAGVYHFTRISGSPDGWNVAYYIFTFFRGIMFFSVVVLIGTGWSYMKPFLGSNEKRILMIVIPLQVVANVAIVIMSENTPAQRQWFTWRDIMHLLDIICCCAVLFPIVWSIKHLRDAARTDGKAARSVQKLTLFRQFYVMVVVYIYFTRIVVYLLQTTLPYRLVWVSYAAEEVATLVFYILTACHFRPIPENPYLQLNDAEAQAAGIYRSDED